MASSSGIENERDSGPGHSDCGIGGRRHPGVGARIGISVRMAHGNKRKLPNFCLAVFF